MTAAKKTAHAKPPARAKSPAAQDAIALLKADHAEVKKLFAHYEKLVDAEARAHLADLICDMLTVHTTIEEEIFYPAARGAIDEDDLLDEAEVEHASAKELIAQLEGMQPEDDLYDAKVKVLGEYVAHHVKEEEDELFPAVQKTTLDLRALGSELAARKEEILAEMGIEATN